MKDSQAKYPQLRFKGFTDPWEERKLGKWFAERTERSGEGEMLSVTISSGVVRANSLDRKDNSSTDKSNYKVVHIGDIAYNSMRMWQAASGVSNYDGIVSPAYTVLVPAAEVSSVFFGYQFKQTKMKQIFQRNSQGLTSDTWNLKYPLLAKIKTSAPQKTEQVKIGTFFATLDHLIAVNQRKLAKLKELKQGYLQKLFPKNGSKFPQLRFAGFADAWEQRKLGDYGSVKMNKRIFKNQTSPNGDIPFYKIGTFGKKADSFISKKLYEKYKVKYPYPKIGDLLISASGSIGKIIEYKGKKAYFQDSNIVWLSHNSKLLNIYLKQYYQRINWNNIEGTTIKRLYNKDILTTHISVPNIKEQKRIGNLLNLVDNLLDLHQRKLEKLQELKKGYLQKMFC